MANGHSLIADESIEFGETNYGPSTYDYLVAALELCMSKIIRMISDR